MEGVSERESEASSAEQTTESVVGAKRTSERKNGPVLTSRMLAVQNLHALAQCSLVPFTPPLLINFYGMNDEYQEKKRRIISSLEIAQLTHKLKTLTNRSDERSKKIKERVRFIRAIGKTNGQTDRRTIF